MHDSSKPTLLDELRAAKNSHSTLKQEILMAKTNFHKVFVFEGITDYGVYDEWLKNDFSYQKSGHITGKGKKQLVSLYKKSLELNDTEILGACKFYVDQDYDMECLNDEYITTLKCYSVENYIVNEHSLRSFLKDEFRLDARRIDLLESIVDTFKSDLLKFNSLARRLCEPLFLKHNIEGMAKFYDKISSVIDITYGRVNYKEGAEKIEYDCDLTNPEVLRLVSYFRKASDLCSIKGKYHFEFFKLWLCSLKEYMKARPEMASLSFNKDPFMIEMRRLASATPVPAEVMQSVA